jgi:methylated-DNA-protein-cysteine methyltransferase-like protein
MMKYTSPRDKAGYYQIAWQVARLIPSGKVSTYGDLAAFIPAPDGKDYRSYRAFGARWVAGAIKNCPDDVPWHRVINSQGRISLRGAAYEQQRKLLEAEGVVFDERDRVDLNVYRWIGPDTGLDDSR